MKEKEATVMAEQTWHCEKCNKLLARKRGQGTVVECRGCGWVNEA